MCLFKHALPIIRHAINVICIFVFMSWVQLAVAEEQPRAVGTTLSESVSGPTKQMPRDVATVSTPVQLPAVIVTSSALGSELFDLASPASVLSDQALALRTESTLGETLNRLPGVNSTGFGPNASRPVIRGLDGDRVRILQNGATVSDASALSYDHAIANEALLMQRVEVVRGPAALMYGGNAIGGVVNVQDDRVPLFEDDGVHGRAATQLLGPSRERSAAANLRVGAQGLNLQVSSFTRNTEDQNIPGSAVSARLQSTGNAPGFLVGQSGRQPNSSAQAKGGNIGLAWATDNFAMGLSRDENAQSYGTVAEQDVRIDLHSRRWDWAGEWRAPALFETVKFKASHTDYHHEELEQGVVGTTFKNRAREARLDLKHVVLNGWQGAWGLQMADTQFAALGDEAFVPTTRTKQSAVFAFEEKKWGGLKLDLGARVETTQLNSAGGGPIDPGTGNPRFDPAQQQKFITRSGAIGLVYAVRPGWNVVGNLSHTERAPTFYELFANGPHVATAAYEVGNRTLKPESARSLDVALRWRDGVDSASMSVFHSNYRNYLALQRTGSTRGADGELNPIDADNNRVADGSGEEIFPEYAYQSVRARFSGLEWESQTRLAATQGKLDLHLRGDMTRAIDMNTGKPLPRIPPLRLAASLIHQYAEWNTRVEFEHVAAQGRVADNELPTDRYSLVHASLSYTAKFGATRYLGFLRLNNMFNREARNHVSLLKDIAPLPGRNVQLGLRVTF